MTTTNNSFRYETDAQGYITNVFFGCMSGNCKEFVGLPSEHGYQSWTEWADNECINAWKIEGSTLVHDENREAELLALYEEQSETNRILSKGELLQELLPFANGTGSKNGSARIGNLIIEWGTTTLTSGSVVNSGGVYFASRSVALGNVYAYNPCVIVGFTGSYDDLVRVESYGVSTTSFSVAMRLSKASVQRTIQWFAIGVAAE